MFWKKDSLSNHQGSYTDKILGNHGRAQTALQSRLYSSQDPCCFPSFIPVLLFFTYHIEKSNACSLFILFTFLLTTIYVSWVLFYLMPSVGRRMSLGFHMEGSVKWSATRDKEQ